MERLVGVLPDCGIETKACEVEGEKRKESQRTFLISGPLSLRGGMGDQCLLSKVPVVRMAFVGGHHQRDGTSKERMDGMDQTDPFRRRQAVRFVKPGNRFARCSSKKDRKGLSEEVGS